MNNKGSKLTIDVRPVETVQAPGFWEWVDAAVAVAEAIASSC